MCQLMAFVTERHAIAEFIAKFWMILPSLDVMSMKTVGRVTLDAFPTVAVFDRFHPHLRSIPVPLWVL